MGACVRGNEENVVNSVYTYMIQCAYDTQNSAFILHYIIFYTRAGHIHTLYMYSV